MAEQQGSLGRLGQTDVQFCPLRIGALVAAHAVEALEQVRDAFLRDTFAGIADPHFD